MALPSKGVGGGRTTVEQRRLLDLVRAQLEHTRREGQRSVDELTRLFTALFETAQRLGQEAGADDRCAAAHEQAVRLQRLSGEAIGALQFYDRLSQRIGHAIDGLEACRSLTAAGSVAPEDHAAWSRFWSEIGDNYVLDVDRELLAFVLAGASSDEALERLRQRASIADRVELF